MENKNYDQISIKNGCFLYFSLSLIIRVWSSSSFLSFCSSFFILLVFGICLGSFFHPNLGTGVFLDNFCVDNSCTESRSGSISRISLTDSMCAREICISS